jgi:transposase-like protein
VSCAIENLHQRLDAGQCRTWWMRRLHPAGPICPDCRTSAVDHDAERFRAGLAVVCDGCGRRYSWRTGTMFEGRATADERQVYVVAALSIIGVATKTIAQAAGMSTDSVLRWQRRMQGEY